MLATARDREGKTPTPCRRRCNPHELYPIAAPRDTVPSASSAACAREPLPAAGPRSCECAPYPGVLSKMKDLSSQSLIHEGNEGYIRRARPPTSNPEPLFLPSYPPLHYGSPLERAGFHLYREAQNTSQAA